MKPAPFAYAKARSLDHALELLGRHGDDARILAGGQSLMPALNMRLDAPSALIDINGIGLCEIRLDGAVLEIGALTRHVALERSPLVAAHAPLIAAAIPHIAHPAIRNRGTIGGSIALADPAAELPACLLALGGEVEMAGPAGRRRVAADVFFLGLFATALQPGEIVTAIRIPAAGPQTRSGFAELARRRGDYAMAGLAASGTAAGRGFSALRLVFFGVGDRPQRARAAEAAVIAGEPLDSAVAALARDLDPAGDLQAGADTKRHLAGVLLRRVLAEMTEAA